MGVRFLDTAAEFPASVRHFPVIDAMESPGVLTAFDPGHPNAPWAGIPVDSQNMVDLAGQSRTELGIVEANQHQLSLAPVLARTSKGGLRVTPAATAGSAWQIRAASGLRQYLQANITHALRLTLWLRMLSPMTLAADNYNTLLRLQTTDAAPNHLGLVQWGGVTVNGSAKTDPHPLSQAGMVRMIADWKPDQNAVAGTLNAAARNLLMISQRQGPVDAIVYRMHLVDKVVDGRSDAELDEVENVAYNQAFGAGGRYFGDTWA